MTVGLGEKTGHEKPGKEICKNFKQLTKGSQSTEVVPAGSTADVLSCHYAAISTDPSYVPLKPKISCLATHNHFSESEVFYILDHLQPTATGLDRIPASFLRLTAPVFSAPIVQLFNRSIDTATVAAQWMRAFITPIPRL